MNAYTVIANVRKPDGRQVPYVMNEIKAFSEDEALVKAHNRIVARGGVPVGLRKIRRTDVGA